MKTSRWFVFAQDKATRRVTFASILFHRQIERNPFDAELFDSEEQARALADKIQTQAKGRDGFVVGVVRVDFDLPVGGDEK